MNKKGQLVMEVMVVISVLVIGMVLFGIFYLQGNTQKISVGEQLSDLSVQSPVSYEVTAPSRISCGNGMCDPGETCESCSSDCFCPRDCECPSTCSNGVKDGSETRIDCGGDCPACQCESLGQVTFFPASTNFEVSGNVQLSYSDPNCSDYNIYYTIDGIEPPILYISPITITFPTTQAVIKAYVSAIDPDGVVVSGAPREETYTITIPHCFEGIVRGDGSPENPREICNAGNLDEVDDHLDWYYILGVDIDLGVPPYNSGNGWPPIGYINNSSHPQYHEFTGSFNGNNHTISNLYIQTPDSWDYHGLFSALGPGAEISNLHLVNVNLDGLQTYSASLVGRNNGGTINNCSATNVRIVAHKEYIGGLVGYLENNGVISNSYATGDISSDKDYVGGLVGYSSSGRIFDNYFKGYVFSSKKNIGGLIGKAVNSQILNNYVVGRVSGGNGNMGCFMGSTSGCTITSNYYNTTTCTIVSAPILGVLGKPTADLKIQSTFIGWDFINTWNINSTNEGYPHLITNPSN